MKRLLKRRMAPVTTAVKRAHDRAADPSRRRSTRDLLVSVPVVAALATAGPQPAAAYGTKPERPVFVLVHGSWYGAWSFEPLVALLAQRGYGSIARDLPGHGLLARFPAAYFDRPLPPVGAFNTEPSPLAGITLADYVQQVAGIVETVTRQSDRRVVLVGHSLAGLILNAVGEQLGPKRIQRLVYLAGWMPATNTPIGAYLAQPSQADSKIPPLLLADPATTGALRLDPRSVDSGYQAGLKAALYADVSDDSIAAITNLLTPDDPAQPFGATVTLSKQRWGRIPRTYVTCSVDQAIRPATQAQMIAEADALNRGNPTHVVTLASSHSPFLSQPEALAGHLAALADY